MSESMEGTLPDRMTTSGSELKRHAACDECRKRKLKCSGEPTGCVRCLKQSIPCRYSPQKPMGRPPKKRARADEGDEYNTQSGNGVWPTPEDTSPDSFTMSSDQTPATDAHYLCPQLYWQGQSPSLQSTPDLLGGDEDHNHTWRPDRLKNPNIPVYESSSPWPDFSAVSESTAMPFSAPTNFLDAPSLPLTPPMPNISDPNAPQCTCLSYLYLCLSHISSISSFPVNSHTLCSLYIAARTAQDVIRCQICPKSFATGVQNVMFTGTLLTVVADAWLRVYNSDAAELGLHSAPPEFTAKALRSADPAQTWREWLRQIVRRAVVGGYLDPEAGSRCSGQPDLLSLIREVEDRQRHWHEPGKHPCEGHNPIMSSAVGHHAHDHDGTHNEKELLCLRVVGSARSVLLRFKFEARDFPGSAIPNDLKHASP
ncbi:hypothetical protein N7462_000437 [Penicillium macrosclerotiorum]|uniref:uncharacterized protein n=1 Tax=Penicillium macrosclerotiorum TaxID=303699 RepID=UPI002547CE29|nr:uncharacterized protein N7462_000437 [Penicillium macrosclerotiorum]KAJ5698432.1 hypothetical protein N7462_000437 [Penicillium macrosclerotiorum]